MLYARMEDSVTPSPLPQQAEEPDAPAPGVSLLLDTPGSEPGAYDENDDLGIDDAVIREMACDPQLRHGR